MNLYSLFGFGMLIAELIACIAITSDFLLILANLHRFNSNYEISYVINGITIMNGESNECITTMVA
jgi:hypothetical protein